MDFGNSQHLSELRIVLIGYRGAGKSSAGNSILGREEFDLKTSAQCVRRHGEVADRHITITEAPGWWRTYTVEDSTKLLKQEIVFSVSLCPPGPHAVLLIIRVDIRFKETLRKALQEHLDLLGERVWSHTIVLFTHGDSLLDTSIEQHIEREGQDLQWLLDKCGNRYHVLNNKNKDQTQIKELLEKIEETVTQNNGCHFEINSNNSEVINQSKASSRRSLENATHMIGDEESASFIPFTKVKRSKSTRDSKPVRKFHSIGVPPSMSIKRKSGVELCDRRHTTEPITTSLHRMEVGPSRSCLNGGSNIWSQVNSAPEANNSFGSSCSIVSTGSSGYGSLCSLPQSIEQSEKKWENSAIKISELSETQDEYEDMNLNN